MSELKAAAERLRRLKTASWQSVYGAEPKTSHLHDMANAADAYLDEHDPAPITEEALRELGFEGPGDMTYGCLIWRRQSGLSIHTEFSAAEVALPHIRTIGQLCQLIGLLSPEGGDA